MNADVEFKRQAASNNRIVVLVSSLGPGGTERAAVKLAGWLAANSYDVTLFKLYDEEVNLYPLPSGVKSKTLHLSSQSRSLLTSTFSNLRRVSAVRRAFKAIRPAVCISMGESNNTLALLASRGLNLRVIISERCDPSQQILPLPRSILRKALYGWADCHVAQSNYAADWFSKLIPGLKQVVIGNAAPNVKAERRNERRAYSENKPLRILSVGRLIDEKRHHLLLAAAAQLLKRGERAFTVTIAGDGPLHGALNQYIDDNGLRGNVTLLGNVTEVGRLYREHELFVMCSEHEGFPNSLVEAMAYSLPVLAFLAKGGVAEILVDGGETYGFVLESESADYMADVLRFMMDNPGELARYSGLAEKRSHYYSESVISAAWLQLLARPKFQ